MKVHKVYKNGNPLNTFMTLPEARTFVAKDSGQDADWALRYEGYEIKRGVQEKKRGKK